MLNRLTAFLAGIMFLTVARGQSEYSNFQQQTARINALAKSYPQHTKLSSLTKTAGGKDIWLLTIGTGDTDAKPAIAVIGGADGNHLLGTELAIGFAENLLQSAGSDSIKTLLSRTTFYVFPNINPDASEQYFAKQKYERMGNAVSTDDDRDGKLNEDGYEDLDGNGKIGFIRVESPVGDYRTHPDDPRVMIRADVNKGEKGNYFVYTEGIDNDKDGKFNEDGEGGIWINKNFSFKHPSFTAGSGEFPVSEKETRALLDTLYTMFNVYGVVSFGANNNLSAPTTFNANAAGQRLLAGWLEQDTRVSTMVSELYNKVTPMKDAPKTSATGGDLFSWAYFHYGRYSFSTPGWYVPKAKPDTTKKEKPLSVDDPVANYLRWAAQQGINSFSDWKTIQHPDFPGQKVEAGGIDPFVLSNPPYKLVADIVKKHSEFLVKLAGYQPGLEILNLRTEAVGSGMSRITLTVANKGALASHSKLGERSYWVKRINVKLNTANGQTVIAGKKNQLLNSLDGFGSIELSWLIKGPGTVSIEAGSPTTGTKKLDVKL
jgi:hypothetical protein